MDHKEESKKIILVSDTKTRKYAEMFAELLQQENGQWVSISIYSHQEYLKAYPGIRPEQYIIYFGKNKLTKNQTAEITEYPVDCFGMKYGRQGNRAVLFADKVFLKKEKTAFGEYYAKYQQDYKEHLEKVYKNPGMAVGVAAATGIAAFGIAGIFLAPLSLGALAVSTVFSTAISLKHQAEVTDVQYRCLMLAAYMEDWQAICKGE